MVKVRVGLVSRPPLAVPPSSCKVRVSTALPLASVAGVKERWPVAARLGPELKRPGLELAELSMGMTADFEVAIEEGATLVRVGTALFGPRPAPPA